MRIYHLKRCPLSKSYTFDQSLMRLGHIKYHDVFFKFDDCPYHTLPSGGPLLMKIHHLSIS